MSLTSKWRRLLLFSKVAVKIRDNTARMLAQSLSNSKQSVHRNYNFYVINNDEIHMDTSSLLLIHQTEQMSSVF